MKQSLLDYWAGSASASVAASPAVTCRAGGDFTVTRNGKIIGIFPTLAAAKRGGNFLPGPRAITLLDRCGARSRDQKHAFCGSRKSMLFCGSRKKHAFRRERKKHALLRGKEGKSMTCFLFGMGMLMLGGTLGVMTMAVLNIARKNDG